MDYIAHGLWSYIAFHKIRRPLWAVGFGLLPDSSSWLIYVIYRWVTNGSFGRPVLEELPWWIYVLYNISHSLIISCGVIVVISLLLKRVPVYMLAWPLAILLDIPTHTRDFLPTPFLWPLSEWRFDGFSWASTWFVVLNYSVMLTLLLWIRWKRQQRTKKYISASNP